MAGRRALVVIDAQVEYFTGALPIEYPDRESSLERIATAIDAAVEAGVPVVLVRHDAPEGAPAFAVGSDTWQLHPVVAARASQAASTIGKAMPSAFAGTELEAWLRSEDITTVTFAGYMTQNCDQATVVNATHLGFAAEFLSDASGAVSLANEAGRVDARTVHETFCTVLQSRFAAVMTTDEWLAVLDGAAEPVRSTILASRAAAQPV